jgi:hypothetical protein
MTTIESAQGELIEAPPVSPKPNRPPSAQGRRATAPKVEPASNGVDKSLLAFPEPRRLRNKAHLKFVSKQPCLVCGRQPSDTHHLRFAQHRALGRKVSDEFTVPLCRGHHREVHRTGDEAAWWARTGVDALGAARKLWTETHSILAPMNDSTNDVVTPAIAGGKGADNSTAIPRVTKRGPNSKTKPVQKPRPHDVA